MGCIKERTHKRCPVCAEDKPLDEFHIVKPKRGGTFLQGRCKVCNAQYCRRWFSENKHRLKSLNRQSHLRVEHGLTPEAYEALFQAQNGLCAICFRPCNTHKNLSIDHDHKSGKIRGLLCRNCNCAIGQAREDVTILKSMIAYLER